MDMIATRKQIELAPNSSKSGNLSFAKADCNDTRGTKH
jgi:hypothetical protein